VFTDVESELILAVTTSDKERKHFNKQLRIIMLEELSQRYRRLMIDTERLLPETDET
jgi:hypothetical protein